MTVTVGFRHVVGRSLWSRLIRVIAGPPVHCAFVFPSGLAFHATLGAGVEQIFLSPEELAADGWELIPFGAVDPLAVQRWCRQRVGAKYDWVGAVLYGTALTTRDRWTCSEFCAEGLVNCGAPLELLQASQTPRRLLLALRDRLQRTPAVLLQRAA